LTKDHGDKKAWRQNQRQMKEIKAIKCEQIFLAFISKKNFEAKQQIGFL
jgi:hypothetical protein